VSLTSAFIGQPYYRYSAAINLRFLSFWEVTNLSGLIAHKQTNSVSPPNQGYSNSFLNVKFGRFQKNGFRKILESEFCNR